MPNGGSDCCGTCWFNARNKGQAGYDHSKDSDPNFCTIRELIIEDAFWTYCGNHPHRRREKDPIPIGPVFKDDGNGRRIWKLSPDTAEIRDHLLALAATICSAPDEEYPIGVYADELVVWQLGEFHEQRATPELRRIADFPRTTEVGVFRRTHAHLVALAKEALEKIQRQ